MTSLVFAGAGWITPIHAMSAKALGIDVVGFASRTRAHAEAKAAEFGGVAFSYEQLPAGSDIVLVATPPSLHTSTAFHALAAGAAVLVERPFASTLYDADSLVEASRRYPGRVGYAVNTAFAPAVQELLRRRPGLGEISHIEARALDPRPSYGQVLSASWGGGALFDRGASAIALVLLVAGPAQVRSVKAKLVGGDDHDSDEYAEVTLTLSTGVNASVIASCRGDNPPIHDVQLSGTTGVLRAELLPTANLEHDGDTVTLPRTRHHPTQVEELGYLGQLKSFTDAVKAGASPMLGATFGRSVLEVICAAYASAGDNGRSVALPFAAPRDRTPLQLWKGLSVG